MKTLQVQNSFEPYHAGRDGKACKWEVHPGRSSRSEPIKFTEPKDELTTSPLDQPASAAQPSRAG